MDMVKALKKLGEMLGEHIADNICDASQKHVNEFLHSLPEWLGGDAEKKELLDALEEFSKDVATNAAKHYLKIDLKKYLD